jgi:hydroxymethylglutaryl-CoA lyase
MTTQTPRQVRIREVGPRDGFQNEPETIDTKDKVALINALGRASFTRIELASFVRPDVIPQLSDGVEVLSQVDLPAGVERMVLIPNSTGLTNALKVRELFDAATVFVSASPTHNKKNVNRTVEETMADVTVMAGRIRAAGIRLSAVIATAFGCPYEGRVPAGRVLDLAERFAAAGAAEIGFGDTTGMASRAGDLGIGAGTLAASEHPLIAGPGNRTEVTGGCETQA